MSCGGRRRFVRLNIREPKGEPDGLSRTIPMSEAISGRWKRRSVPFDRLRDRMRRSVRRIAWVRF
jgi:hypothetical protein